MQLILKLINKVFLLISKHISAGHERSVRIKINLLGLVFLKGLNIGTQLVIVPIIINYINPTQYGVWITLSSVIGWFTFFDIGLSNGLRNKFAEAKAKNDIELAKTYVSTAYASLIIISIILLCVFIVGFSFIDWLKIFNAPFNIKYDLGIAVFIVFSFFCIKFVLQLISTILISDQKPALSSLINTLGNIISLVIIYFLSIFTKGTLISLSLAVSIAPIILLFFASVYLFNSSYKIFRPSFYKIDFRYFKDLMNLGIQFFVIQIAAVFLFTSSNFVITHFFGPDQVTVFHVAQKYFNVVVMLFFIVTTPMWSAYTEAFIKNDIIWIKNSIKKLIKLWGLFVLLIVVLLIFSNHIFRIWVPMINVPYNLRISLAIYVLLTTWNGIYVSFINGIGKIRVQLFHAIFIICSFLPLLLFLKYNFNLNLTVIAGLLCFYQLIGAIWTPIQFRKIITNEAKGIWNK